MEKRGSVLLVDDEKMVLLYLNQILGEEYDLLMARNSDDALRLAAECLPDLILSDIIMPGADGYETLAALKAGEKTREIPVMLMTGLTDPGERQKGLAAGAADMIAKPFNAADVRERVRRQIEAVRGRRA